MFEFGSEYSESEEQFMGNAQFVKVSEAVGVSQQLSTGIKGGGNEFDAGLAGSSSVGLSAAIAKVEAASESKSEQPSSGNTQPEAPWRPSQRLRRPQA